MWLVPVILVPVSGLVLLVGVWLLLTGIRGVRATVTPTCPRCQHSLVGIPYHVCCPECGAEAPATQRVVARRRRPRRAALGLVLCAAGSLLFTVGSSTPRTFKLLRSIAPLWVLRIEARGGTRLAMNEIADRIRAGSVTGTSLEAVVDEALDFRRRVELHVSERAACGFILDEALATGRLDAARAQRCLSEAVGVGWWVSASNGASVFLKFAPAVGYSSTIDYEAAVETAELAGVPLPFACERLGGGYCHVPNPAVSDTYAHIDVPDDAAGKLLAVRWRVKIFDALSKQPLAPDWVHTETFVIPSVGSGDAFGFRAPPIGVP